ncbi:MULTISPECIES: universal stress protein [Halorussus]|uniref:universal stress protein n=1 Tax=Halorussus TaxID=1070314 RepID=UPI000E211214|nr:MULTISPECIES: universal stress protein [Halorussus]NHN57531.1 universal stress protein [Halorussus sp. JP-T4]
MSFSPVDAVGLAEPSDSSNAASRTAESSERDRVLVPLFDRSRAALADQLRIAGTLARTTGAALRVVAPARIPPQAPLGLSHRFVGADDRERLDWGVAEAEAYATDVERELLVGRRPVSRVRDHIRDGDVDAVVLPGESTGGRLRRSETERLAADVDCDVVTVNGRRGYDEVPSILLPVAGGPHSGLAADVARQIAAANDAWVDVLHVVEEDAGEARRREAEECAEAAYRRIGRPETTTTWVLEADDPTEAIVEQSRYYELTVVGAPTTGRLRRLVYGSTSRTIGADAESVVLSARSADSTAFLD